MLTRPPKAKAARAVYDLLKIEREEQAYKLRLLRRPLAEIAAELGVKQDQARRYLSSARERRVAELRALDGRAGVLWQFDELHRIYDDMMDRWEASKRTKKVKHVGVDTRDLAAGTDSGAGPVTETRRKSTLREEEELGEVAYVDRALKAASDLRALLGLDAPTVRKLVLAEDTETKALDAELDGLTDDELLARYWREVRGSNGVGS